MSTKRSNAGHSSTRPFEAIDSEGPPQPVFKRRKRGNDSGRRSNPFIALEASEGEEEGEEDGEEDGEVRYGQNDGVSTKAVDKDTEPRGDMTYGYGLEYLSADAETLVTRFKKKAASSDAARSSGVLEESIGQALLQPTIDDYEIHAIPLRSDHRGKEAMGFVEEIYKYLVAWQQAYEQGISNKTPPNVSCIFISPADPASLYVECRNPIDCSQLMSVFNYGPNAKLVNLEDRRALLSLYSPYNHPAMETLDDEQIENLSTHVWVRTRDGDIAYVVDDCSSVEEIEVLRLPLLPLKDGGSSRRLLQYQDILALLDPKERSGRYKAFAATSNLFWMTKKGVHTRRVFLGGLEQVPIPTSRTTVVDSPDPQDLLPFVEARENSIRLHALIHDEDQQSAGVDPSCLSPLKGTFFPSDEFEWLTAGVLLQYADRFYSSTLSIGDRVTVKDSAPTELHGITGLIVDIDNDLVKIQDGQNPIYAILRGHIKKVFGVGDLVRVISGPHRGVTGMVLVVRGQLVHVLSGSMTELLNSEISYQQSNSFTVPIYSLQLEASSAPKALKAKFVPCGGIGWNSFPLFELGDEVTVKRMKGVVERIDGDFYTITLSSRASVVVHYSELHVPQALSSETRHKRHWLVGKDVMIVRDSPWKGSHGVVKDVSFPAEAISNPYSPGDAVDHTNLNSPLSRDETGVALIQISSHAVFHANTMQSVPFRNLAFDLSAAAVPHITPVVPTVLTEPVLTEPELDDSDDSPSELEQRIKVAEEDIAKGAHWLLRERTMRYRTIFRFRLRHREGKSMVNAWTTRTARHSLTPDGKKLVEVERTGYRREIVLAQLTSLSIAPIQQSNINGIVFTLYQAHHKLDIGILEAVDGTGSDARCTVNFGKEEDLIVILAKFLVLVVG